MRAKNNYAAIIANVQFWGNTSEISKGEMLRLLQFSVAQGIHSFKFNGELERNKQKAFGLAFSESGLDREELQFVVEYRFSGAFSSTKFQEFIEETLLELHTDYLDLLVLNSQTEVPEAFIKATEQLLAQGKIREIGSSNFYEKKKMNYENFQVLELVFPLDNFSTFIEEIKAIKQQEKNLFVEEILSYSSLISEAKSEKMRRTRAVTYALAPKYAVLPAQVLFLMIQKLFNQVNFIVNARDEYDLKCAAAIPKISLTQRDFQLLNDAIS